MKNLNETFYRIRKVVRRYIHPTREGLLVSLKAIHIYAYRLKNKYKRQFIYKNFDRTLPSRSVGRKVQFTFV